MRLSVLHLVLAGILISISSLAIAQPVNDNCAGAINLGALPTPQSCTSGPVPTRGIGAAVNNNLTSLAATPSSPYPSMTGCQQGNASTSSPASDVWYQVTLTGSDLIVGITGGINQPNFAIWSGGCGALVGMGCATGNAGTLNTTFVGMVPGTYLIQISGGNVNDRGNFTLTLQNNNNCAACLVTHTLTVNPLPTNGYYQAGTVVDFCFRVTGWTQQSANWLHGVELTFGAGWNVGTIVPTPPASSCDGTAGTWGWYPGGCTGTATGNVWGNGFYFDRNNDGNPGNNFGDNCTTTSPGIGDWVFCWRITTDACGIPGFNPDLSIVINTLADGESGSWGSIACQNDPDVFFSAQITCCPQPVTVNTNVACFGACTATATSTGQGTGPWNYTWFNQVGMVTIRTANGVAGPDNIAGLCAGTYIVRTFDTFDGCTAQDTFVVTQPAQITGTPAVVNVTCNGGSNGSITINGTAGGVGPYQYSLNGGPFQVSNVFGGLTAGTYTVTIRDANNCTITLTNINVNQPAAITGTPAVVHVLCNGGSNGSITINGTAGGVGPYQYSLNGGPFQVSNVFSGLTAGTYNVVIRDANNCTIGLVNINVNQPAVITGTPAVVNVLCNGGNTGSITINGTAGGVGPYQYSLNGGPFQVSNVFNGLTAGTYTVTIRDANNCTVVLSNINVNQPAVITGTPAVVNVVCNGGNTGSITINGTAGGVGPYQYSLNGGPFQVSNVFNGLTAGTYTVTIRDANNCTVTINNINVNQPAAITGTPAVVNVLCNGGNTGSITINGTAGGVGPYQYSLNGGPFQVSNVFGGLTAGTYTVTIRDANNCTVTINNINVNQPAAITGTPAVVNVLCNGGNTGSITINGTAGGVGPYQYSLNGGPFQVSNVFGGLTAGTYSVTIRDANNCTVTINNINVNQPAALSGTPAVVNVLCNGGSTGSITINGTAGGVGPYQYSLNGGPFQASNVFGGLPAGTYTVTIRDANNCTLTLNNINVTQPAAITGTPAVVDVTCGANNGSITINGTAGGVGPYQYSLNGGPFQASNVFGSLGAGTYSVTIRDANNCTVTINNITVNSPAALSGTPAVVNVTCNGGNNGSITVNGVSGGTGPYQYSLNGGPFQASNVFPGLTAGTYSVTIRDANLCTVTYNNINVNQPAAITGTPAVVNVLCNGGSTGSITINGTAGGTAPYQYSLNGGPFQASNVFNGLPAGTNTVTIRDVNNCTLTLNNIVVNQPAAITGTPAVVDVTCGANNGSITINGTAGGVGPYQYSLNGGPFQASNVFGSLAAGTYSVTIRDANNCTVTINNITVNSPAALSGTPVVVNVTCNGGNNGSITVNAVSGGTGPYQYSLNGGPFQASNVFNGLTAGTYTVTIQDANLCTVTYNNINVNQPAAITGTPAVVNVLCNGGNTGSITINGTAGGTAPYQYSLNGGPFQASNVFPNLTAGTYTVTIRDANNCTVTINNINVNQPAALAATPAVVNVLCNGGSTGSITINGTSGGVGPYQYSLNGGPFQASNVFNGLPAGTYTVTVRDANNCTLTLNNIVVNEPAALIGTPAVVNVLCFGQSTGSITINGTGGGVGPYQYSLNGGPFQASNVFNGLPAGTYTVTVRDANNCTLTLNNIVVNEPAQITGSPSVVNVTCNAGNDGSITMITMAGGVAPYQYSLNGGPFQASNVFNGLTAGTYTVTVRDANNCTVVLANITIIEPAPISGTPATVNVACNGGSTGSITINGTSGGTAPFQYSLNGGPFQASNVFNGLPAGTYTVTIRDANNCTVTLNNIVINEPTSLGGTPQVVDITCFGANNGSITLNGASGGTPGYQYSLNGGPLQASNTFTALPPGNYTLTMQDINGCVLVFNGLVVNEPAALTATDSTVMASCIPGNDGEIWILNTAGGTPGYLYSLDGGPTQAGSSFTAVSGGTHTVTVTDQNGCTLVLNVTVPVPGGISATDSLVQIDCNGASNGEIWVMVTGGTPAYQYSLNGGPLQAGNSFTGLGPGAYTALVQDQMGCSFTVNVQLTEPPALAATDSTVGATCNPGSDGEIWILNATGGVPGYQYSLNGGPFQASNSFIGLNGGNYIVTLQDQNGCTFTLNTTVASPGNITATDSTVNPVCDGDLNGEIWITAQSSALPLQYSLNGGAFQASSNFTGLGAGIYTVDVRDALGCTVTLAMTLTAPAPVAATDSVIWVRCNGGSDGIIYVVGVSGGTGPYQYSIGGGPFQASNAFTGLSIGTYVIAVQDVNGCGLSFTATVQESAPLVLQGSTQQASCGNNDGSATVSVTGGSPPYIYLWSDGQSTATASNLFVGSYTVTVTDINGCAQTLTQSVTNVGAPTVSISQSSNVTCFGAQDGWAVVTVTGGGTAPFQYAWNTTVPVNNDTLSGVGPGIWVVQVTDALGCVAFDSVTITEPAAVVVVPSSVPPTCFGGADGTASVAASGGTSGYTYTWSNGGTTAGITGLSAGTYDVTVTDANGCTQTSSVTLADPLPVSAGFNATPTMPAQLQLPNSSATFLNLSQNASTYLWTFGDGTSSTDVDPSHTYTTVGNYCVTLVAQDAAGCADTAQDCSYTIFQLELEIPNTFTPNNDGRNDVFQIVGIEMFPNNHLAIFNRWGNLVYEKDQYNNTWKGENYKNGAPLPDGAYYYIFTTGVENQKEIMGDVVIFR